jgi:RsiW-degrading membrane proteinase PrsW (M82 family)
MSEEHHELEHIEHEMHPDPEVTHIDLDEALPLSKVDENTAVITWTNRRRMAWLSLIAMILTLMLCIFYIPLERLDKLNVLVGDFFWCMFAVIAVYMGSTSIPFMWRK